VSVDGLWTIEFSSSTGFGTGVVVFANGKILGGDAQYHYTGTYSEAGPRLMGEVVVRHYTGPLSNVFEQVQSVRLTVEGSTSRDLITAQGYDPTMPQRRVSLRLRRVTDT